MNTNWTYEKNDDNTARYVLGIEGNNSLICFGVNCSSAEPNHLDRTVTKVREFAAKKNFDGFIMLNLYPQRATDPKCMHQNIEEKLHKENLNKIKDIIKPDSTVWAAWGNLITSRTYLAECLREIYQLKNAKVCRWIRIGELTLDGHPRHPSRLPYKEQVFDFNMQNYLKKF